MARSSLLPLLVALAAAGCHDARDPQAGAGPLRIRATLPERAPLGEPAAIRFEVENAGKTPVAIVSLRVREGDRTLLETRARDDFKGFRGEPGHATLTGNFEMEEIGPAARLPMSPRWEWEGDIEFVNPAVLAPGATLAVTATAQPLSPDDAAVSLDVAARALRPHTELLTATGWKTQHVDDAEILGAPHGMGWTTKLRKIVALAPADAVGARSALLVPPLPGAPLPDPAAELSIYPHFLARATLDALPAADAASTQRLVLGSPGVALDAARQRAQVATGTAIYVAAARAWWLDDPAGAGAGALVSADQVARCAGARAVAERIALDGTARVGGVFPDADAKALHERFAARGLSTTLAPAKGGGLMLTVVPTGADAFAFLQTIGDGKVALDGLRLVAQEK